MSNPFYVEPLGNAMPGIERGLAGLGAVMKEKRAEDQRQQLMQQAGEVYDRGDPDEIAKFSMANPEIGRRVREGIKFKSDATEQNLVKAAQRILSGEDPAKVWGERVQMVEAEGGDASHSRQELQKYQQDPEGYLKQVENNYALSYPDSWGAYRKATAAPALSSTQEKVVAAGLDPNSPEGQAYARKLLEKTGSNVTVNTGFKLPSGYQYKDPANPDEGVMPIPGGPADSQNVADASKTAMLQSAQQSAQDFETMVMPGGEPDYELIATMTANVPHTNGRTARVLIKDAIEAKLRAESGAAVPESEVSRAAERFMPSVFDDKETIKTKMNLLNDFLNNAVDRIRPDQKEEGASKGEQSVDDLVNKYAD